MARHRIVTRFAVPRQVPGTVDLYRDPAWLDERLRLFRRIYVPSVARLGLPAVLLCGSDAAAHVADRVTDLAWVRVVEQDDWTGGLPSSEATSDETLHRLDSDDAVHPSWLQAVERAPSSARVVITKQFLRWDLESGRVHRYAREEPSPLAAFRAGVNPYAVDHKHLETLDATHVADGGPYLLSVVHGGNVKNRRPKWWRLDRRVSRERLAEFGLTAKGS